MAESVVGDVIGVFKYIPKGTSKCNIVKLKEEIWCQKYGIDLVVIIALTEVFGRTFPSKIIFPFPWNPFLKTDGTSLIILFLIKNFEEKEI